MNLKKRKQFTPEKEDSFLMSLSLSSCFSFQTWTDLVLVKFCYNACFWKILENLQRL